jgi:hypothetical protein
MLQSASQTARPRSAVSLARKAAATMTRLLWRGQSCQDRASQASQIVLGAQEAFLDGPAQARGTSEIDWRGSGRSVSNIKGHRLRDGTASPDQHSASEIGLGVPEQGARPII